MCDKKILLIEDLCVAQAYRRNRIGSRLFEYIHEYAKTKKIDSIELNVWNFNQNAIEFYENLGMSVKHVRYEMKAE